MKKSILAVGAHADDIEMSMSGTILKYMDKGYTLTYVLTTNNMSGEFSYLDENGKVVSRKIQPAEEMKIRKKEAAEAAEKVFGTKLISLDFPQRHYTGPDNQKVDINYGAPRLDFMQEGVPSILTAHEDPASVAKLTDIILECDPEVIITRGMCEYNIEHICTALYTWRAREQAMKKGYDGTIIFVKAGLMPDFYCGYNTFIDTTGLMQKKIEATRFHSSQKPCPEKLDWKDWNIGAQCGCETAEPFIIGAFGAWKTGLLTAELLKNHLYCRENYTRMKNSFL